MTLGNKIHKAFIHLGTNTSKETVIFHNQLQKAKPSQNLKSINKKTLPWAHIYWSVTIKLMDTKSLNLTHWDWKISHNSEKYWLSIVLKLHWSRTKLLKTKILIFLSHSLILRFLTPILLSFWNKSHNGHCVKSKPDYNKFTLINWVLNTITSLHTMRRHGLWVKLRKFHKLNSRQNIN